VETQVQTPAVEKWKVTAIVCAVEKNRSFGTKTSDEAKIKLYEDAMEGRIKNVYGFEGPRGRRAYSVVVAASKPLGERELNIVEELARARCPRRGRNSTGGGSARRTTQSRARRKDGVPLQRLYRVTTTWIYA